MDGASHLRRPRATSWCRFRQGPLSTVAFLDFLGLLECPPVAPGRDPDAAVAADLRRPHALHRRVGTGDPAAAGGRDDRARPGRVRVYSGPEADHRSDLPHGHQGVGSRERTPPGVRRVRGGKRMRFDQTGTRSRSRGGAGGPAGLRGAAARGARPSRRSQTSTPRARRSSTGISIRRQREDALNKMIAEFNSTNPYKITVKGEYAGGYNDIYNKMVAAIAGGAKPRPRRRLPEPGGSLPGQRRARRPEPLRLATRNGASATTSRTSSRASSTRT